MLSESFRTCWATSTHGGPYRWPSRLSASVLPDSLLHMDLPVIKGWHSVWSPSGLADGHLPTISSYGQGEDLTLNSSQSPSLLPNLFLPSILLLGFLSHWIRTPFSKLYFTLTISNKEPISKYRRIGDLGLRHVDSSINTHASPGCWPEGMKSSGGVP